jgi:hypothetical protein
LTEGRKASDVLLDLEKKLDEALSIIRTQDLNIKILSNKMNLLSQALDKQNAAPQKITVEAINANRYQPAPPVTVYDPAKNLNVSSEMNLPLETEPKGFRRTSRPETYAGDNAYLNREPASTPKYPVQIPKMGNAPGKAPPGREAEVVVPPTSKIDLNTIPKQQQPKATISQNAVPVMQRVVSAQGKSLFLADVEIIDLATMQQISKTRTNGMGKWMASLSVGNYRVIIRKLETLSQDKKVIEATQDIQVDGQQSPLELQTIIIK